MKLQITFIQLSRLLLLFSYSSIIFCKSPAATSSSSNFNSEIPIRYQLTLSIPTEYVTGFIGKALLMTTTTTSSSPPGFTTALVVEAINGQYACSLDLYIGTEVRVWSSGHRSKFFATGICVLELTQHGDLRLKGAKDEIGWRTGTTEQGVQKLQLLDSGNLVLMNGVNRIIWQSFNFPTNTLLLQQRLSVATHLTAYPTDSHSRNYHYSLEIQHDKLALYLNIPPATNITTRSEKYSYWDLRPSKGKNITYVELTSTGLELFDDSFRKFAQIDTIYDDDAGTVRFMSVDNVTGNLGMYCYGKDGGGAFKPCFQAISLSNKCDFPLRCKSNYSVCTFSGGCSCITVTASEQGKLKSRSSRDMTVDCEERIGDGGVCGGEEEMIEVEGAVSVFKSGSYGRSNVSRNECVGLCLEDCGCRGVMYGGNECVVYGWVLGVKEIGKKKREVYMVKVEKRRKSGGGGGFKGWVLVVVVVGDGLILVVVVAGIGYFVVWTRRRKRNLSLAD